MSFLDPNLQRQIDDIIAETQRIEREIDSKLERVEKLVFYRLDFYADHFEYKNKRFSFKCSSEQNALKLLRYYLDNGNKIRACYLNFFEVFKGIPYKTSSYRLNIDEFERQNFSN